MGKRIELTEVYRPGARIRSALTRDAAKDLELVCTWAIACGFGTGHADTIPDLLAELTPQVKSLQNELIEFRAKRDKDRAAVVERVRKSRKSKKGKP